MTVLRYLFLLLITLTGSIILVLSWWHPGFAVWYGTYIFPIFPHIMGRFFNLFPFSVFEIIFVLGSLFLVFGFVFIIINLFTTRGRIRLTSHAKSTSISLLYILSSAFLIFVLTAGVNYSRESYSYHTNITVKESSTEELIQLYLMLVERAEILATQINTDDYGHFLLQKDGLHDDAIQSMQYLNNLYGGLVSFFPRAKAPMLSRLFLSNLNIGGFFSPWTMEAHYNGDMPGQSIPFVINHELAHFAGHMREDEANFIGYLASINSPNIDFQYSAVYTALSYTLNAMRRSLSRERYQELFSLLPQQLVRDFAFARSYWQAFEGPAAELQTRVNDAYLRLNQQEDGVQSYGRMVDLLLAYYRN